VPSLPGTGLAVGRPGRFQLAVRFTEMASDVTDVDLRLTSTSTVRVAGSTCRVSPNMSRPSTHGARVGDSRSTGIVGGLALVTILRLFQASHKVAAQRRAPAE